MFKQHWDAAREQESDATYRGFERVDGGLVGAVWQVADHDNVLVEVEAWKMLQLEDQARLTATFPLGR
jgi:hypothetical protein